jgi:ferredoxin--NADP+ reductase
MENVGNDPEAAKAYILSALKRAKPAVSDTRMRFEFLSQPKRIIDDGAGGVGGLEVEDTTLVLKEGGRTSARGLGTTRVLDVDTVIFAIGDKVDELFGLPVVWNEFAKNPSPSYAQDGVCYEAFDPEAGAPLEGVFVAGWSREASTGLVGAARKDGRTGAQAVLTYLQAGEKGGSIEPLQALENRLEAGSETFVVRKDDVNRLEAIEAQRAKAAGIEEFKFDVNAEMLAAIREHEAAG